MVDVSRKNNMMEDDDLFEEPPRWPQKPDPPPDHESPDHPPKHNTAISSGGKKLSKNLAKKKRHYKIVKEKSAPKPAPPPPKKDKDMTSTAMVPILGTDTIMGDEGKHLKRGAVDTEETDDEFAPRTPSKKAFFRKSAETEIVLFDDVQFDRSSQTSNQKQNVVTWAPLLHDSNPWSASPPESIDSPPENDVDKAVAAPLPPSPWSRRRLDRLSPTKQLIPAL